MTQLFSLLKIKVPDYLGLKHKSIKTLLYIIVYLLLGFLIYRLCNTFNENYANLGIPEYIIGLISAIINLFLLILSFKNSDIYNMQEYELLISMPIKKWKIVFTQYMQLYVTNLFITLLAMIPCLCSYFHYTTFDLLITLRYVISLIFMPMLITSISIILSSLIVYLSSKFKNHTKAKQLITILFLGLIFLFSYLFMQNINDIEIVSIEDVTNIFKYINPIYPYFIKFILESSFLSFIVYASICTFTLLITVFFFSYSYSIVLSKLNNSYENTIIINNSVYKKNSKITSFLKKDLKYTFSNITDMLVPYLPALVLVFIAPIIKYMDLDFTSYYPKILILLLLLSNTTSISISSEYNTLGLLKTLPIYTNTIFFIKILPNLIINITCGILSLIIFNVMFTTNLSTIWVCLLTTIITSLFTCIFGLFINLFIASNNIKTSSSSIISTISLIFIGIIILWKSLDNMNIYILLIDLIFIIVSTIMTIVINIYGTKILSKYI